MMRRILLLLTTLAVPLTGQEISVPERPADHVLDQTGTITPVERQAVQAEMEQTADKTGLGVYLVLLNSAAEEPPADVARRLAQAWKDSPDRVVVLTAPDLHPPLVIAMAGESLSAAKEEEVKRITETAVMAGQRAAPGITALLESARSVAAQVQESRAAGMLKPGPAAATEATGGPPMHLVAWIAGGSVGCCLLALMLMRRGRHSALIFPHTEFRRRFSAPHSGGNDAVVHFGK